jgi:CheY-like chemotaxis protein
MSAKFWSSLDMNRQLRILVAQDDRARRESLREQIGSWGFEVEAVYTRQALEMAQTFEPDSLLTELEVQGNDGQTILHELRARGLEIATIVISKETELANAVQTINQAGRLQFSFQADQYDSSAHRTEQSQDSTYRYRRESAPAAAVDQNRRARTDHHRARLVERVPSDVSVQSSDRSVTSARVHLRRTARVEFRLPNLAPFRALGFIPSWTGNPKPGVGCEFGKQKVAEVRLETDISVEPEDIVIFFARREECFFVARRRDYDVSTHAGYL